MTSLSVTETWKHFRRTLYQHVNLSLYFCFASRFPPKLGHIRHPWYVSHARLVLHKRMHLTRTLWPFCCDYNPVLKRWSCLLLYFGFLCSYLRKNIAYVFLICYWMICSRQLSILSRILKLHMTGSKSSIAMLLILSEICLLFFNFMLIRPAFSTPSIIFAHCQLRLVLFVSPHILHSLSFRQVHIYLKNMRNKHYCGAWDVMLWDGFQGPLAIYKTLHGTHRNYAV